MTDEERKAKRNAYMKAWYHANKDKARATIQRHMTTERREAAKRRSRKRYAEKRGEVLAYQKAYHQRTYKPKGKAAGTRHAMWKGEEATYTPIHQWVIRHKGRPQACEHCGTTEKRMYHWANVDHQYKRNLADYIRLCVPCHRRYDYTHGLHSTKRR